MNYHLSDEILFLISFLEKKINLNEDNKFQYCNLSKLFDFHKKIFQKNRSKGTFTKEIEKLVEDNYLLKEYPSSQRKVTAYSLTEEGRGITQLLYEQLQNQNEEAIKSLNDSLVIDKEQIFDSLNERRLNPFYKIQKNDQIFYLPLPRNNEAYFGDITRFLIREEIFLNEIIEFSTEYLVNPWSRSLGIITGMTAMGKSSFVNFLKELNNETRKEFYWMSKVPSIKDYFIIKDSNEIIVMNNAKSLQDIIDNLINHLDFELPLNIGNIKSTLIKINEILSNKFFKILVILDQFEDIIEKISEDYSELEKLLIIDELLPRLTNIAMIIVYRYEYQLLLKENFEKNQKIYNKWLKRHASISFSIPDIKTEQIDNLMAILEKPKIFSNEFEFLQVFFSDAIKILLKNTLKTEIPKINGIEFQIFTTEIIKAKQHLIKENLLDIRSNDLTSHEIKSIVNKWLIDKLESRLKEDDINSSLYWEGKLLKILIVSTEKISKGSKDLNEVKYDFYKELEFINTDQLKIKFEKILTSLLKDDLINITNDLQKIEFSSDWIFEQVKKLIPEIDLKIGVLREIFRQGIQYDEIIPLDYFHKIIEHQNRLKDLFLEYPEKIAFNLLNHSKNLDKIEISKENISQLVPNLIELLFDNFSEQIDNFFNLLSVSSNQILLQEEIIDEIGIHNDELKRNFENNYQILDPSQIRQLFDFIYENCPKISIDVVKISQYNLTENLEIFEVMKPERLDHFLINQDWEETIIAQGKTEEIYAWYIKIRDKYQKFLNKNKQNEEFGLIKTIEHISNFFPWTKIVKNITELSDLEKLFDAITYYSNNYLTNIFPLKQINWNEIFLQFLQKDPDRLFTLLQEKIVIRYYWILSSNDFQSWLEIIKGLKRFDYFLLFVTYIIRTYTESKLLQKTLYELLNDNQIISIANFLIDDAFEHEIQIFKDLLVSNVSPLKFEVFNKIIYSKKFKFFNHKMINSINDILSYIEIKITDDEKEILYKNPPVDKWRYLDRGYYTFDDQTELICLNQFNQLILKYKQEINLSKLIDSFSKLKDQWEYLINLDFYWEIGKKRFLTIISHYYSFLIKKQKKVIYELHCQYLNRLLNSFSSIPENESLKYKMFSELSILDVSINFLKNNVEGNLNYRQTPEFGRLLNDIDFKLVRAIGGDERWNSKYYSPFDLMLDAYHINKNLLARFNWRKLDLSFYLNFDLHLFLIHREPFSEDLKDELVKIIINLINNKAYSIKTFIESMADLLINIIIKIVKITRNDINSINLVRILEQLYLTNYLDMIYSRIDWEKEFSQSKFSVDKFNNLLRILKSKIHEIDLSAIFNKLTPVVIPKMFENINNSNNPYNIFYYIFISLSPDYVYEEKSTYHLEFGNEFFKSLNIESSPLLTNLTKINETKIYFLQNLCLLNFPLFEKTLTRDLISEVLHLFNCDHKNIPKIFFPLGIDHFQTDFSYKVVKKIEWGEVHWNVDEFSVRELTDLYHFFDEFQDKITRKFLLSDIKNDIINALSINIVDESPQLILQIIYNKIPSLRDFVLDLTKKIKWNEIIVAEMKEDKYYWITRDNWETKEKIFDAIVESGAFRNIQWDEIVNSEHVSYWGSLDLLDTFMLLEEKYPKIIYSNHSLSQINWKEIIIGLLANEYHAEKIMKILDFLNKGKNQTSIKEILAELDLINMNWNFYFELLEKRKNKNLNKIKELLKDLLE